MKTITLNIKITLEIPEDVQVHLKPLDLQQAINDELTNSTQKEMQYPNEITEGQRRHLFAVLTNAFGPNKTPEARAERLEFLSWWTGRNIESSTDLTFGEALEFLSQYGADTLEAAQDLKATIHSWRSGETTGS